MPFFLNPTIGTSSKGSGGGDSNTTTVYDMQLNQMENVLSKDGYLSPADLQQLAQVARQYAAKLDTPSKRATMVSKALAYEKQANDTGLKSQDITAFNQYSEDDYRQIMLESAGDPGTFLDSVASSYRGKVDALDSRLQGLDPEDSVSFAQYAQAYNEASQNYSDWTSAAKSYKEGKKDSLAAYATTDPNTGEIVNIEYVPIGKNTIKSATKTNLTVEGMPLYLVPNQTKNGVTAARFQNIDLVAPAGSDSYGISPDGTTVFAPKSLQTLDGYSTDFKAKDLRSRSFVPVGGYALGMDGKTLYQNEDGVNYKKFSNFSAQDLGIDPNSIIKLPAAWEKRLTPQINKIVDKNVLDKPGAFVGPLLPGQKPPAPRAPQMGPVPQQQPFVGPPAPTKDTSRANQQPSGQELAQQHTNEITKGGLFNKIVDAGKKLFKIG